MGRGADAAQTHGVVSLPAALPAVSKAKQRDNFCMLA